MHPEIAVAFVIREKFSWTLAGLQRLYALAGEPFALYVVDGIYPEPVRAELDAFLADKPRVVRIRAERFLYPNEALNLVVGRASEPYLFLLQNDVLIGRHALRHLLETLTSARVDVAVPLLLDAAVGTLELHRDTAKRKGIVEEDGIVYLQRPAPDDSRLLQFETHCLLMTMQSAREICPLPPLSSRDHVDLCLALWRAGRRARLDERARALFVDSPPFPLREWEAPFYRFRWDRARALQSHQFVADRWRLADLPSAMPMVIRQQGALEPDRLLPPGAPASEPDRWPADLEPDEGSIDVVVIAYRSEAFLPRLREDLAECTRRRHTLLLEDNTGRQRNLSMLKNDLAARGDSRYLLFLNPDVALAPGWDATMIEFLDTTAQTGAVLPLPVGDGRFRPLWEPYLPPGWAPDAVPPSRTCMAALAAAASRNPGHHLYDGAERVCPGFALLMTRRTFDRLRGFDERLRFFGSERDVMARLQARGTPVRGPHRCVMYHAGGASFDAASPRGEIDARREWEHRDRVLVPLAQGSLARWHLLSAAERAAVREDPRYTRIGGPLE